MGHTSRFVWRFAWLIGLASLGVVRPAWASPDYPPVLAAAIAKELPNALHCVPLCTACHLTTMGGPGELNVFGINLETIGGLSQGDASLIDGALVKLIAADPDSDGDGTHDVEELTVGDSPSIAGPAGDNQFCPDIKYGCGASIATPPPVDNISLIPAGLAVLGLAVARRRRVAIRARLAKR